MEDPFGVALHVAPDCLGQPLLGFAVFVVEDDCDQVSGRNVVTVIVGYSDKSLIVTVSTYKSVQILRQIAYCDTFAIPQYTVVSKYPINTVFRKN